MRFSMLLALTIITTLSILFLNNYNKYEISELHESNETSQTNSVRQLQTTFPTSTDLLLNYMSYCNNTITSIVDTSQEATIISRLRIIFQQSTDLSTVLSNYLNNPTTTTILSTTTINSIIKKLIPFFVVLGVIILGWLTCCSCCCYGYCPIVCKRKKQHTSTSRLIPVIIVFFTGCSVIIPSILAFIQFGQMKAACSEFYCELLNLNNVIITGQKINQTETFDWLGLSDTLFLQNLLVTNLTWLDMDFTKFNNEFNKLNNDLQDARNTNNGYIYQIKQLDYYNMTNPSITNRNLTEKNIPQFFKDFENNDTTSFANFMNSYYDSNFQIYLNLINDTKNNYTFLSQNRARLANIYNVLENDINSALTLQSISYSMLNAFQTILFGTYESIVNLVGVFLLAFQILLGSIAILSSILILANVKNGFVKYLSHSSWCLSALSLLIMGVVLLAIYAVGSGVINLGFAIENVQNPSANYTLSFSSCFNNFNKSQVYNEVGNDQDLLRSLDALTNNLYQLMNYDTNFNMLELYTSLSDLIDQINDPTVTLVGNDGSHTYAQSEAILNKITDYRVDLPYMVMNCCGKPTSYQMKANQNFCTYPLIDGYINTTEIFNKKVCLLIPSFNTTNIYDIFYDNLNMCTYSQGKFLDADYTTLYEELETIHYILYNYLIQYSQFQQFVTNEILVNSFQNVYYLQQLLLQWRNSTDTTNILSSLENILKINSTLSFKDRSTITFTEYVSCTFYSTYLTNIIGLMNNNMANSIYSVVVCYMICMIFNTLSAIFGLISSIVNSSYMKKKKIE